MAKLTRPTFLLSFLDVTRDVYTSSGWIALVPVWFILCCATGGGAAWIAQDALWTDKSLSVAVYAAILTLNGLLLALAWGAFAKIYENVCSGEFSRYLRENGLLSMYMYQISYANAVQVIAVMVAAAALLSLFFGLPRVYERVAFAAVVASSGYALREALGAVTLVNDLIWYRSIFDSSPKPENVTRLRGAAQ